MSSLPINATGSTLLAPVAAGETLVVLNGYDNPAPSAACPKPGVNEHDHCGNQADGLDLVPSNLADTRLLAPARATVSLVDSGCVFLDIGSPKVNLTMCHFGQVFVGKGDSVVTGEVLGLRDTADPWVHISFDSIPRDAGVSLAGIKPLPFVGSFSLQGRDLPAATPPIFNQYQCTTFASTNKPSGAHAAEPTVAIYTKAYPLACGGGKSPSPSAKPKPTPTPTPKPKPTPKPTPTKPRSAGGPGRITFKPPAISCSSPVAFTSIVQLPSSVHVGDTIAMVLDGRTLGYQRFSTGSSTVHQADGSWTVTNTSTASRIQSDCESGLSTVAPGTHTEEILDSAGKVLAKGSYTVTP